MNSCIEKYKHRIISYHIPGNPLYFSFKKKGYHRALTVFLKVTMNISPFNIIFMLICNHRSTSTSSFYIFFTPKYYTSRTYV